MKLSSIHLSRRETNAFYAGIVVAVVAFTIAMIVMLSITHVTTTTVKLPSDAHLRAEVHSLDQLTAVFKACDKREVNHSDAWWLCVGHSIALLNKKVDS